MRYKVFIPFLQSLITGLLLGASATAVGHLRGWPDLWAVFVLVMAITSFITWIRLLPGTVDRGRFVAPLPRSDEVPVRVAISHQDGLGEDWLDLPLDTSKMIKISERLLDGGSFSHASLAGPGRPLSRAEYEALRDLFVARGLARWINEQAHNQGLQLTGKGRAVARGFASMAGSHPPRLARLARELEDHT